MFEILSLGAANFFTATSLAMLVMGCAFGLVVGVLPGLGPLMGIVLLTPFVFFLPQVAAMGLLIAVYVGGSCGGAISAILLRIPGTPLAAATLLDGYPLAQKGQSSEAIGLAVAASATGGILGGIFLIGLSPALAEFALRFGPFEYFAMTVLGMMSVAVVSEGSAFKGIAVALLGLFVATVGADQFSQYNRFTFGTDQLLGGLHLVAVVVGVFALPEMILEIEKGGLNDSKEFHTSRVRLLPALAGVLARWVTLLRASTLGTILGALPGAGGVMAAFIAYAFEKSRAQPGDQFGEGEPKGVIATEASNNACVGGSLIPSLALAVPGDAVAAVLLGALILIGYFPGPTLFENNLDVVGGIFLAYVFANVALLFLGVLLAPIFAFVLRAKKRHLVPVVLLLSVAGTFAIRWSVFDLWVMLAFGLVGYALRKANYPLAPLVIGLVLGPICEENLRRSLLFSGGDYGIFFDRPIAATILWIVLAMLVWICIPRSWKGAAAGRLRELAPSSSRH